VRTVGKWVIYVGMGAVSDFKDRKRVQMELCVDQLGNSLRRRREEGWMKKFCSCREFSSSVPSQCE
jgi:hypothetical protein